MQHLCINPLVQRVACLMLLVSAYNVCLIRDLTLMFTHREESTECARVPGSEEAEISVPGGTSRRSGEGRAVS